MHDEKSIFVAIPVHERVSAPCVKFIAEFLDVARREGIKTHLSLVTSSNPARARGVLAHEFMGSGAARMLMVDADTAISCETVFWMLNAETAYVAVAGPARTSSKKAFAVDVDLSAPRVNGLIPSTFPGCSPALIRRSVFERLLEAHQAEEVQALPHDGNRAAIRYRDYFGPLRVDGCDLSYDRAFCLRCQRAGIGMYVLPHATVNRAGVLANLGMMLLERGYAGS